MSKKFTEINTDFLAQYTKTLFKTYTEEKYKNINYCRGDLTKHLILLKCLEFYSSKKDLNLENILNILPDNAGSRSHRINCINDLCSRKILEKIENPNDKRSYLIVPSLFTVTEYITFTKELFNYYINQN